MDLSIPTYVNWLTTCHIGILLPNPSYANGAVSPPNLSTGLLQLLFDEAAAGFLQSSVNQLPRWRSVECRSVLKQHGTVSPFCFVTAPVLCRRFVEAARYCIAPYLFSLNLFRSINIGLLQFHSSCRTFRSLQLDFSKQQRNRPILPAGGASGSDN